MAGNESLKAQFQASAADVDTIFTSFRSLYEVYNSSLDSLSRGLSTLPRSYQQKLDNAQKAFENMAKTVATRQEAISGQLYSQGIVILVGNAESLMRDMFRELVISNFRKLKPINDKGKLSFSLSEIIGAKSDSDLGIMLLNKLEGDKNPAEKLNFQNMQALQGILKYYFGITIPDNNIIDIHVYWQIRHIIIHNQSAIDKRFLRNLRAVGIDTEKYRLGSAIELKKEDYESCFAHLTLLFEKIDEELTRLELSYDPFPF